MRRSAAITLTLLAASTGLGVAMCHRAEPDTEGVLESQAACVDRLGPDAAAECDTVFQSARATHAGTAPRFGSEEDCRAATGADCTPLVSEPHPAGAPWASAGPTVFIPAMAGVMIGRALSDGSRGAMPVYAGGMPPACLPGAAGGLPGAAGCPPASSSGTGGSGSGGGGSGGGGGRRYWYSGGSYAGSSEGAARGGFRAATASGQGGTLLSRGVSASRAGGFGSSAAAHGGGGS